jgi:hypothetical protein
MAGEIYFNAEDAEGRRGKSKIETWELKEQI